MKVDKGAVREAIPVLIEGLKSDDKTLRSEAAEALGEIGPDATEAIPVLTPLTKDKNKDVRKAAADALRNSKGNDPGSRGQMRGFRADTTGRAG